MKYSVLLSKTGSALTMDPKTGSATSRGDGRNAQGLLRYLGNAHPGEVCYVGRWYGELPDGVNGVQVKVNHICPDYGPEDQEAAATEMTEKIRQTMKPPYVFVELSGHDTTTPTIDNPWYVVPQISTAQHVGVVYIALAKRLEKELVARILVQTDPKTYPRHHEMLLWPHFIPKAVLSQHNMVRDQGCREYHKIRVHAVNAGVQHWFAWDAVPYRDYATPRPWKVGVLAHSHIKKERMLPYKYRDAIWTQLLDGLDPATTRIHGDGWEEWSCYRPDICRGVLPLKGVDEFLREVNCGPMIPAGKTWQTTKHLVYALQGAAPIPWGTDPEHENCYDPACEVWPIEGVHRVMNREDLERWAGIFELNPKGRQHYCDAVIETCKADFSMLEEAIERAEELPLDDAFGSYTLRRAR